ncbi:MAG: YbaB/EbfC family nucleoid-associated protein [Myxococcota bacterium]|nr:YbaB/EbfC family nucleoid-associated protein [Myxococcota bacterium]
MSAPGPDMKEMLEQAQRMQTRIAELQQELSTRRFEASSGGGMVTAVVTGQLRVLEVRIEPSLFEDSDRGMIEDLTAAAMNAALEKAQRSVQEELQQLQGKMGAAAFSGPGR